MGRGYCPEELEVGEEQVFPCLVVRRFGIQGTGPGVGQDDILTRIGGTAVETATRMTIASRVLPGNNLEGVSLVDGGFAFGNLTVKRYRRCVGRH